ncbi:acetoin dehydrogenase e1 component beta-subunit [hydrocarbon metagenome]|uniref:Acetoin dehydrogenase e1 component beta-subunit n=1 Tax=hydrocarbon metagenome TaxID=938273 RepID=A0A0W8EAE2_9ZZZZ
MKDIRYIFAIKEAMQEEMERDESVFLMGEDVGLAGGSFGASKGLFEKFGEKRVIDTPISEAGFTSLAAGAASCGLRPIIEIMFMDFVTCCMDSVVNQIAKMRYMFGNQYAMPIVVRMPEGGGQNAGPQHSQCLEAWFAHIPGLKVVMAANPYDVKGLLKSSIRDDNPVIFIENKTLHAMKGQIPEEDYVIPLGKADVKRAGSDVTVVTASRLVNDSLKAAEQLEKEGISVEVVDLMTIQPWDRETVFNSIVKTHRLVVAHEAVKQFGFGAEISAAVNEELFDELDAPIFRVGAPFVPIHYSLEKAYVPGVEDVKKAIMAAMG